MDAFVKKHMDAGKDLKKGDLKNSLEEQLKSHAFVSNIEKHTECSAKGGNHDTLKKVIKIIATIAVYLLLIFSVSFAIAIDFLIVGVFAIVLHLACLKGFRDKIESCGCMKKMHKCLSKCFAKCKKCKKCKNAGDNWNLIAIAVIVIMVWAAVSLLFSGLFEVLCRLLLDPLALIFLVRLKEHKKASGSGPDTHASDGADNDAKSQDGKKSHKASPVDSDKPHGKTSTDDSKKKSETKTESHEEEDADSEKGNSESKKHKSSSQTPSSPPNVDKDNSEDQEAKKRGSDSSKKQVNGTPESVVTTPDPTTGNTRTVNVNTRRHYPNNESAFTFGNTGGPGSSINIQIDNKVGNSEI